VKVPVSFSCSFRGIDDFTLAHQLLARRPPLLEVHTTTTFLKKCWIKLQQMKWEEPELLMKGLESVPIVLLRTITAARTVMFVGCLCNVHIYWISLRVASKTLGTQARASDPIN
jgi:hypothetical protein